jgi:hypothetical protein
MITSDTIHYIITILNVLIVLNISRKLYKSKMPKNYKYICFSILYVLLFVKIGSLIYFITLQQDKNPTVETKKKIEDLRTTLTVLTVLIVVSVLITTYVLRKF